MARKAIGFLALVSVLGIMAPAQSGSVPVPINMTGTWETQNEGFYVKLHQVGEYVVGKTYKGSPAVVRGGWSLGFLVLVIDWTPNDPAKCEREALVISGRAGTVRNLEAKWFHAAGSTPTDKLSRTSADGGEQTTYPYSKELKACGDLLAYELAFDVGSDVLKGNSWPILASVGDLLKQDTGVKFRIAGHTDSTGSAAANKTLSLKRAATVKKKLVERYGADAARLVVEGMGADQPLAKNDTDFGRAMNRRVEISIAR